MKRRRDILWRADTRTHTKLQYLQRLVSSRCIQKYFDSVYSLQTRKFYQTHCQSDSEEEFKAQRNSMSCCTFYALCFWNFLVFKSSYKNIQRNAIKRLVKRILQNGFFEQLKETHTVLNIIFTLFDFMLCKCDVHGKNIFFKINAPIFYLTPQAISMK